MLDLLIIHEPTARSLARESATPSRSGQFKKCGGYFVGEEML